MTTTKTAQSMAAYEQIEMGRIDPEGIGTDSNIRSGYDKANLRELAENIAQLGVVQNLVCRPYAEDEAHHTKHTMCLVCGARRLAAAKMAGVAEVPYILLKIPKEEVPDVQLYENLHRENMTTMDEANAFKTMLDQGKFTKEDLAARANKSVSYVTKAIALCDLPEAAIAALEAGKLTPSHCHQILRVQADSREDVVKFATTENYITGNLPTLKELIRHIDSTFGRQLDTAVFPQDCEYADRPACAGCQQNSVNQTLLFAEAEAGACLDPDCYAAKVEAFDAQVAEEAATKYKGMKCLGTKTPKYNCNGHQQTVGKGIVVAGDLAKNPEIKKAMKAAPEKFAYAVDATTHRTILVLQDAEMISDIKNARQAAVGGTEGPYGSKEREKQEYITKAVQKALLLAGAEAKITVGVPEAIKILQNLDNPSDDVLAAFGLEDRHNESKLVKLPLKKLLHLIYLCSITRWDGESDEKLLATHGVNVKAVKKTAAKEAAAQYAIDLAEAAAKAAEAKHGKKAKGGEEEETKGEE